MKPKNRLALAFAFAVSFLAIGLPYWQIPYSSVSLPNSLVSFGLLTTVVMAAVTRILAPVGLLPTILVVGAAASCAVMARVVYDCSIDPTAHNLWPFEIVIAIALGGFAALVGAVVGGLLASTRRKDA